LVPRVKKYIIDTRLQINKIQYFGGVPEAVWEFHIGGYQVCEKWLKDRKLSCDDIQHYQKIVVALSETIRLMAEIDKLIPSCRFRKRGRSYFQAAFSIFWLKN